MNYNREQALKFAESLRNYSRENIYSTSDLQDIDMADEDLLYFAERFVRHAKHIADDELQQIIESIDVSLPHGGDGEYLLSDLMVAVDYIFDMEDDNIPPLSETEQFFYHQIVIANAQGKGVSDKELLDCYDPGDGEVFSENTLKDIRKRLKKKRGIVHVRGVGHFDPRILAVENQESKKKS